MTHHEKGPRAESFGDRIAALAESTEFDHKRLAECSALLVGYGEVK